MILRPYRDKPRHERSSFGNFTANIAQLVEQWALPISRLFDSGYWLCGRNVQNHLFIKKTMMSHLFCTNPLHAAIQMLGPICGLISRIKIVVKIQKCRIRSVHHLRSRNDGISAVTFGTIIRLPELVHIAHAFITCIGEMPEGISSLFGVEAHLDVKSNLCIVSM